MDHSYIEERNIADLYVIGKLSRAEQAEFEQHFINCPECIDLLEEIQTVHHALEIVATEETAPPSTGDRVSFSSAFAQPAFLRQLAVLAAILITLIAIPVVLLTNEIRSLHQELDYLKAATPSEPIAQQDQTVAEQRPQVAVPTPQKQPSRVEAPAGAISQMRPQPNTPIFALGTVRRAGQASTEPINEVTLDRAAKLVVFSLDLEGRRQFPKYRATILTDDGKVVWRIDDLRPNNYGALTMSFDSSSLRANDYLLALEGIAKEGKPTLVANYSFHITRKRD